MSKTPLLEIKDLVTEFQTDEGMIRAVDGVDITLHRGETVGIVGESGSGKSVTSLSAMRLVPDPPGRISKGEIIFHERDGRRTDLLGLSEQEMRRYRGNELAMIFQEPMTSLNPVYTCGDQVIEAIMLHQRVGRKKAREQAIELFKKVKLPRPDEIFDSFPHQLSGGQKQRVMIAMAMSCHPSVLIADEPTTALDVTVQKTILDLMGELQLEHDMGIMFITHDLGVIAELADRVVVMYKGKVVEEGHVLDIFSDPQHPYTKGLLACRPPLERKLHRLPTIDHFMDREGKELKGEDLYEKYRVTDQEQEARREKLYRQTPIMSIEHIKQYFPVKKGLWGKVVDHVKAVDDVSFDVYPEETLGLVGESGCGKTTLGRTMLRLLDPTEGRITFEGEDITHLSQKAMRPFRKDIQIIFQDPYSSLNPRITIGEAILEPMKVHGVLGNDTQRKEKVRELLDQVNMNPDHFQRYPHEFSGGQRQRICIARALALEPRFIICDESVSALDVSIQAQVLNLLNDLKAEHALTYIFISHDLSVVKFMSDRVAVMNKGKLEEIGMAEAVHNTPQSEYTKALIDAIPRGSLEDIRASLQLKEQRMKV